MDDEPFKKFMFMISENVLPGISRILQDGGVGVVWCAYAQYWNDAWTRLVRV